MKLAVAIALALVAAVGCGSADGGTSSPEDSPSAPDCVKAEKTTAAVDAKTVALVVDNTASTSSSALPPAVHEALAEAQRTQSRLLLIPVDGAGKQPGIVRTVALDPKPGVESAAADKARPIVLDCVEQWAHEKAMRPTAPGSGILDAIAVAVRQKPEKVIVVSDGVNTIAPFDVNGAGFDLDPPGVAAQLKGSKALAPELADAQLLWTGLGETQPALPQSVRTYLQQMWRTVLESAQAKVAFDGRLGQHRATPTGLPDDPLTVPEIQNITLPCGSARMIPGALLFAGESTEISPGAESVLKSVADDLTNKPNLFARIDGYTAAYGPPAGRKPFSEARAQAVVDTLVRLGVSPSRLTFTGHGSDDPVVNEFPNGIHDSHAAAQNRRVVIALGPQGCHR